MGPDMLQHVPEEFSSPAADPLSAAHQLLSRWLEDAAADALARPHGSFVLEPKQLKKQHSQSELRDLLLEIVLVAQSHPEPVSACIYGRTSGYHIARILTDLCRSVKLLEDRELTELLD